MRESCFTDDAFYLPKTRSGHVGHFYRYVDIRRGVLILQLRNNVSIRNPNFYSEIDLFTTSLGLHRQH